MNARTLVLNADRTPYDIWGWQHVMRKLLDLKSSSLAIVADPEDPNRLIRDGRGNIYYIPTVIALLKYQRKDGYAKYTRMNIYARDRNICQYCGVETNYSSRTIDHVIPRDIYNRNKRKYSFELSSFENVVTACVRCNSAKSNRRPEQAGMRLRRNPRRITRLEAYIAKLTIGYIHPDWKIYING